MRIPRPVVPFHSEGDRLRTTGPSYEQNQPSRHLREVLIPPGQANSTYVLTARNEPRSQGPTSFQFNESRIVNRTVTINKGSSDAYNGPRLWIRVNEFSEGMATWRLSLAELLVVSKRFNATFVEPCILGGRLQSCSKLAKFKMSKVYDLEEVRLFHPHVVSERIFQQQLQTSKTTPKVFSMCLAHPHGTPSPSALCQFNGKPVPNVYQLEQNDILESALQADRRRMVVINIQYYRQSGFSKTAVKARPLLKNIRTKRVLEHHLVFRRQYYQQATALLEMMGIGPDARFDAIHWRADVASINYEQCVDKILKAKTALTPRNDTPTVLISSINEISSLQWSQQYRSGGQSSLQQLLGAGFLKIDKLLSRDHFVVPDLVVLAIWDQIIVEKARRFSTCSRSCADDSPCSTCNYRGNYAQMAIEARQSTKTCWPG